MRAEKERHQQILRHEERQQDIEELRRVLDDAVAAIGRFNDAWATLAELMRDRDLSAPESREDFEAARATAFVSLRGVAQAAVPSHA